MRTWSGRRRFILCFFFLLVIFHIFSVLELYSNSVTEALQKNRNKKSYHLVLGPAASQGLPNRLQCEGIRRSVNVLIYLDVKKALEDGMKLYVSDNRVILTEGFDGILCL